MILLGIDPSLSSLGFGVIELAPPKIHYIASGCIKTDPSVEMHLRLSEIYQKLESIIDKYRPAIVAMEETFVNKNPVSSMKLSFVRGAVMALVGVKNIPFKEFKPNLIKKTIVGSGHAEKEQVMHMVRLLFPKASEIKSFDEADAIATAYTCSVHL